MTVYSEKPSDRFMALFGASAHDVAGVSAQDAVASAREMPEGWFGEEGPQERANFR